MLIILIQVFALLIIATSEDLKCNKYYKRYLKIAVILSVIGIIMELLGWNHLYPFQCILLTSSPLISIISIKRITYLFIKLTQKEPFQTYRNELSDGIWVKNKGDINLMIYYNFYSIIIIALPCFLILSLFVVIKNITS